MTSLVLLPFVSDLTIGLELLTVFAVSRLTLMPPGAYPFAP